jgi:molecular chaperone Hsp33
MMKKSDQLYRYLFEHYQVRGELVQLDQTFRQMVAAQTYPEPVRQLLGELLVATSLLTATLKFEGTITVQLQGDGPVRLAVINGDHLQQLRGVARWEGEMPAEPTLKALVGDGQLIITISPEEGERYQGIVALESDSLARSLESYFAQSEQLATRIWIRTGGSHESPLAAGMLLQTLPASSEEHSNEFEHLGTLTDTIKDEELFTLPAEEILHRLYHEEEVRLFEPQNIRFLCTCSRQRCEQALLQLGQVEVEAMIQEQGKVDMHCDYCGTHYEFDGIDAQALFSENRASGDGVVH